MNNEVTKQNGIKWGPFTLRIPFIHMKISNRRISPGTHNCRSNCISWSTSSDGAWIKF
ncbi:MAG: hypothetical protein CM15mP108_0060 [Gammaproteobacteria bacterium]|nr:MAG: hypothetical protein CM15mP108_0060 [Gammaproteobacteria bacterium]